MAESFQRRAQERAGPADQLSDPGARRPGQITPLSAGDPDGTVEFYAVVFLALGGAIGATVLGQVLGTVRTCAT